MERQNRVVGRDPTASVYGRVAAIGPGYRAKWFVRCLLPAFPFGTLAGLIVLVAGRSRSPSPEE